MSDFIEATGNVQTQDADKAQKLVEQGNQLLMRQLKPADAAGNYAQALQLAPNLVGAHLGMAKANLALGAIPIARSAAEYVIHLAAGTDDSDLAQAILLSIDRRFPEALDQVEKVTRADPGNAYAHALRGYILRCLGNDYDARLAEAKASRLASTADLRPLFPPIVPAAPMIAPQPFPQQASPYPVPPQPAPNQWASPQRTPAQRQMMRVSFALRNTPVVTYSLIGINVLIFVLELVTAGGANISNSNFVNSAFQDNGAIAQGEWWRIFTAMFLHASILHVGMNMLSLYFIGTIVERLYGIGRYLTIYFISGIAGGLLFFALVPHGQALGASGAIAGVFGAMGAFFFVNRERLGPVANSILGQWAFWLVLNVALNLYDTSGIAWQAHLGGIVMGIILGIILIPHGNSARRL